MRMRKRFAPVLLFFFSLSLLLLHDNQTSQNSKQPLWNMKQYLTPHLPSFRIQSKLLLFIWALSNWREEFTGASYTMNLKINTMESAHLPTKPHK